MKRIILNLVLLFSVVINAQTFESVVIDNNNSLPVSEAKVKIEEVDFVTYTNEAGIFSFEEEIPEGDYVVSISKKNYDTKIFLIKQRKDTKIQLKEVRIDVTKAEAKKRRKAKRKEEKLAQAKLKKFEKQKREEEKKLKKLIKQKAKLLTENTVAVKYDSIKNDENSISENQIKYAKILGVDSLELTNKELYNFIDQWMGTPYLLGGESEEAIDCSAFTQRLFIESFDKMYLERMAQKQFNSKYTEAFNNKAALKEGDLLFFGSDQFNIIHVGVYLHNNKFIHSTSSTVDGNPGVKISDLNHPHWSNLFVSAGRRINNE